MFDNGNHVALRRDGVAVVLKTPENEMPQVEYWGRNFGVPSAEDGLAALDAMTLKVTPLAEKPDAALRPSLLPQGAEAFAGRPGLEAYRGTTPVFVRWTAVETQVAEGGHELLVHAKDAVNLVGLDVRLSLAEGGLVLMDERITNIDMEHEEPLTVNWLDSVLPVPRRADHLTQFTGRWPLEKQPQTGPLPRGSMTRDCRHGKTSHESPWLFIASDGEPLFNSGEVWACHLAWSGNQTYRLDNLPQHEPLLGAGELLGPGEIQLLPGSDYATPQVCFSWSDRGLDGMAAQALRSTNDLLTCRCGTAILAPAYSTYRIELGEISSYPRGYKENGGIFCHNNPWISIANAKIGNDSEAFNVYTRTCPAYVEQYSEVHRTEPYVYCQMVAGPEAPTPGEGKNSWLTGTAAWTFVDVSQYLLGVQPTFDGLRLEPHLPAQFTELHIEREWRGVRYVIDARRTGKASLTVDGKPVSGTTVPIAAPGTEEVHVSLNF